MRIFHFFPELQKFILIRPMVIPTAAFLNKMKTIKNYDDYVFTYSII